MEATEWREVFHRQPAHVVIIDTSTPITSNIVHRISEALKNVICLCFSMKGCLRISSLSLFVINNDTERCIISLKSLKFNYSRIYSELDTVVSVYQDLISTEAITDDCFHRLFREIHIQYKEYCEGVGLAPESRNALQLQLTIVTAQKGENIEKQIESITSVTECTYIRKIQVLSMRPSSQEDSPVLLSDQNISNVDIISIDCDPFQLENYFKGWLQDSATDAEHFRLVLRRSSAGELVIKCDLHPRIINPDIVSHGEQYSLSLDAGFTQYVLPNQNSKHSGKVPIYRLEAVATVDANGLCESVVYGQPLIAIPSQCWKLDWEELESNQRMFSSLCELLRKDNLVLVASKSSQLRQSHNSTICSYYFLFPAESNSLLLKKACSREFLLSPPLLENEPPSQESIMEMQECVDSLHHSETFNPLDFQSGLYTAIGESLKRGSASKRSQPRESVKCMKFVKSSVSEGFPTQL